MSKLNNEVYYSLLTAKEKIANVKLIDLSLDDNPTEAAELAALIKVHQLITEAMDLIADKPNGKTFSVSIPYRNNITGETSCTWQQFPYPEEDILLLANNNKVRAIKAYRERHGVGLAEAKYTIVQALDKQHKL